MARPVDHERRAQLLESAVEYVIDRGLSGLSLRPLAAGLGVTPTTLVHHFGTQSELLQAIVNRVRERIMEGLDVAGRSGSDPTSVVRGAWEWSSDPQHEAFFRLVFEVYGRALQDPDEFSPLLERIIGDWLDLLTASFEQELDDPTAIEQRATLSVAVVRGLLLDLLTTGDVDRVERALEAFLDWLADPALASRSSAAG